MHKLSVYGIRGNVLEFLKSYLTNRKQYVHINGSSSSTKDVTVGVPQGSVLGPLFFNIFINDICSIGSAKKILFADDAVFYITASSLESCIYELNQLLNKLSEWLLNNKLVANASKTKLMIFTPKLINNLPDIYFNNEVLEWVTSIKYLGMIVDNKLNFISHSKQVFRKLSQLHGIIYASSNFLPQQSLITIYNSLVYPTIIQNIIIWGGIADTNLSNIKIMMNKILRRILRVKNDENNIPLVPIADMYKSLKLLQFKDIYRLFLLQSIYFYLV